MLFLVRHADAGNRSTWGGEDFQRPLDDHGLAQAEAIGAELSARPVERILSSAAWRCTATVAPLGRALGLPVEVADELAEGTYAADAFRLVHSLASAEGDSVLCSHGDVIPGVLWILNRYGVEVSDLGRCKKASIWELAVSDGRVVGAAYRHPSTFGAA